MHTRVIFGCLLLVAVAAFSPVSANPRFRRQSGVIGTRPSVNDISAQLLQILNLNGTTPEIVEAVQTLVSAFQSATGPLATLIQNVLNQAVTNKVNQVSQLIALLTNLKAIIIQTGIQVKTTEIKFVVDAIATVLNVITSNMNALQKLISDFQDSLTIVITTFRNGLLNLLNSGVVGGNTQAKNSIDQLLSLVNSGNLNPILTNILTTNPQARTFPFPQILAQLQQNLSNGPILALVNTVASVFDLFITSFFGFFKPFFAIFGGSGGNPSSTSTSRTFG